MGRNPAIDKETGLRLVEAVKRLGSQRKAAKELGLDPSTVRRYFNALPEAAAPIIADPLPSSQQQMIISGATSDLWETRSALSENYNRALKLYDRMETNLRFDNGFVITTVPPSAHVAILKEIREHVETSLKMAQLLMEYEALQAWKESVLEGIGEADEETRQRILTKLKQRRALGLTLSGPGA